MGSDNDDVSGKRKGRKVWIFVKNTSMAMLIFMFFVLIILVLDAYKFVSVRVSNARMYLQESSPLHFFPLTDLAASAILCPALCKCSWHLSIQITQHAKFARKKVLTTLQYMDPALIEAHTGMKVLTIEEFDSLNKDLEESRAKIRTMNTQVQQKFSEVLKAQSSINNMKTELEELKKLAAE